VHVCLVIFDEKGYNDTRPIQNSDKIFPERVKKVIKILIVEDEKAINDLVEMNLAEAGYDCTCAYDGIEAADIIEKEGSTSFCWI